MTGYATRKKWQSFCLDAAAQSDMFDFVQEEIEDMYGCEMYDLNDDELREVIENYTGYWADEFYYDPENIRICFSV